MFLLESPELVETCDGAIRLADHKADLEDQSADIGGHLQCAQCGRTAGASSHHKVAIDQGFHSSRLQGT